MMSAFIRNGGKVRAYEPAPEIKRDERDFAPPRDLIVPTMNRLTEEIQEKEKTRVEKLRELLLALTFGEKMEFSEGVTKILLRNCTNAKEPKLDGFILAKSIHLWAKGENGDKKTADDAAAV